MTFAERYAERGGTLSVPFLVAAGLVICRRLGSPLPWGTVADAPARFDRELVEALQLRHVPPRQWLERNGSHWKTVAGSVDVLSEWAASLSGPGG